MRGHLRLCQLSVQRQAQCVQRRAGTREVLEPLQRKIREVRSPHAVLHRTIAGLVDSTGSESALRRQTETINQDHRYREKAQEAQEAQIRETTTAHPRSDRAINQSCLRHDALCEGGTTMSSGCLLQVQETHSLQTTASQVTTSFPQVCQPVYRPQQKEPLLWPTQVENLPGRRPILYQDVLAAARCSRGLQLHHRRLYSPHHPYPTVFRPSGQVCLPRLS